MNYFGKFDAKTSDALGEHPDAKLFSGTVHGSHVPSDAVIVSDAQLLFNAEFKRAGVDLVLSGEGREVVLHDYFKGEHRAPIASPDGAHLTADIVTALAGQVQYAQAGGDADAHKIIGHVTKLVGSATAVRNGVSIILNNGDNVEKGDVVASGSDSTLGITFIDGTVFGLSSNARMVLNEMVYDPNGSNNSSLLSLVAGTITFVAGETAKHGDMKVDTPVATMGIRGTAVLVEIDFTVPGQTPDAKFQVLVEPDGTTGSYILYDKQTLTQLALLDKAGVQINVQNGIASQTLVPLSPEIQKLINDVFTLKFSDNSTTKSLDHFTDSIVPTDIFSTQKFAGLLNGPPTIPVIVNLVIGNSGPSSNPTSTKGHIPQAPTFQGPDPVVANITELSNTTGSKSPDTVHGQFQYNDINVSDQDSVSVKPFGFTYTDAHGNALSLNATQLADIANAQAAITVTGNTGPNASTGNGTADWSYTVADKAFDFLGEGETLTLIYTATVDNNFQPLDQTGTQTIKITITGTNDAPVITTGPQTVLYAVGAGGTLTPSTPSSGQLTFTDPDLTDTHKILSADLTDSSVPLTTEQLQALESAFSATVGTDSSGTGTGSINWTLGDISSLLQALNAEATSEGAPLTLTFTVTVEDEHGVTSSQTITVKIGAEVWIEKVGDGTPSPGDWNEGSHWETGFVPTASDDVIIATNSTESATPFYPVTIKSAEDGGVAAFANSVTMSDFGDLAPELDNYNTLTIGSGGLHLNADSILKNFGDLSIGGIAEILQSSVLNNSGHLTLDGGGDFAATSSITNSGTLELFGGTLNVDADIDNTGGTITIDGNTMLMLNGATISGGTLDVYGTLDSMLVSELDNVTINIFKSGILESTNGTLTIDPDSVATLTNAGTLEANGGELDITNEPVTNTGTLQAIDGSILKVTSTVVTNTDGLVNVDFGSALDLVGAEIDNGTLTNSGTFDSTGSSTLSGVDITNAGTLESTKGTLTITDLPGPTVNNSGTLEANGGELDITNEPVTNTGTLQAIDDSILKLTTTTVTNTDGTKNGTVNVDKGSTLDLVSSEIDDGALTNGGMLNSAGDSTLGDVAITNTGTLESTDGTLTIEPIVGGSSLDNSGTLEANGGELDITGQDVTNTGTLQAIDDSLLQLAFTTVDNASGTVNVDSGAALHLISAEIDDGTLTNSGTLASIGTSTLSDVAITNHGTLEATGGTLTITDPAGPTVVNDGTIEANGGELDITSEPVTNTGTLLATDNSILKLTSTTVNNTNGKVNVDLGSTLDLVGAEIDNATLSNNGTLNATGTSKLHDVGITNTGTLESTGGTLTIDDPSGPTVSNSGTLEANGGELDITSEPVTNTGTLLATDNSILKLTSTTVTNTNGKVNVDLGSTLDLVGAEIDNGTLTNNGTLNSTGTSTLHDVGITNTGTLESTGGTLTIDDPSGPTVNNSGTLEANGGELDITSEPVTNTGTLKAMDNSVLKLTSTAVTNTNGKVNVDLGSTLDLVGAEIDSGTLSNNGTLNATGASTLHDVGITNTGTLESTGGTLTIDDPSGPTVNNSGTLEANGGELDITSEPVTNTGTLQAIDNSILKLTSTTVTNTNGKVNVDLGSTLDLVGAEIDNGTLSNNGTLNSTSTSKLHDVGITNTGTIESTGGTLTIDDPSGPAVNNSGTLEANGGELDITSEPVTNTGTLKATDNSILKLTSTTVTNTNGKVNVDKGSTLDLVGAEIDNGTLSNNGTLNATGTSKLHDVGITNTGTLESTGGTLTIDDPSGPKVANSGTLEANGGELDITSEPVTNTGTLQAIDNSILKLTSTTVTNTDGTTDGTVNVDSGSTLDLISSTIAGGNIDVSGVLDSSGASLISGATIVNSGNVDVLSGILTIDPAPFTNSGTVTVENGATLVLNCEAVDNTNGTFQTKGTGLIDLVNSTVKNGTLGGKIATATGNNGSTLDGVTLSLNTLLTVAVGVLELTGTITNQGEIDAKPGEVDLYKATIDGGTFGGSGTIETTSAFNTLDGVMIAHGTTVTVTDGTTLELKGTITDSGTIALGSSGHTTQLEISGNVSLTGGGNVTMSDSSHNFIVSDGSAATLTNSDTISGAGTIGDGHLTLVNNGTIDATGTHALIINTDVTNNHGGVLEASPGSTLWIDGDVLNNGVIASGNAGGHSGAFVEITGDVTNSAGSTGAINIFGHSTVEIGGSVSSGETVTFEQANGAGLLILDDSHDFKGTIAGLVEADPENAENHVDLTDLAFSDSRHMSVSFHNGQVTITNTISHDSVSLHVATGSNFSDEFEVHSDGHGGTLLDDPSATGTNTIDSGDVLGIGAASSATINFTSSSGNTGELLLNDSKDFTGTITGFAGDGTAANSDSIDIADVNVADVAANKTTYTENADGTGGTLTLYDANGHALNSLNFAGNYELANFAIGNDGNGGTLITEQPANTSAQPAASTVVASAPNQTLTGSGPADNFVFNFPSVGQSTITDFHPSTDTLQFASSIFANAQAALNAVQDDGHGNTVLAIDAHDSITLTGVLKSQLHVSDFHIA